MASKSCDASSSKLAGPHLASQSEVQDEIGLGHVQPDIVSFDEIITEDKESIAEDRESIAEDEESIAEDEGLSQRMKTSGRVSRRMKRLSRMMTGSLCMRYFSKPRVSWMKLFMKRQVGHGSISISPLNSSKVRSV
jgi:hypothetical protein